MLDRIKEFQNQYNINKHLNCFVCDTSDLAKKTFLNFSKKQKNSSLYGKLIAIKDNLNYVGTRTTCASKILDKHSSIFNATVVNRILDNGGLILGKTNMDEFAMGSSSEYSYFGTTRNSINPNYVAGGSSGGSAVAVASGMVDMALGSDTGGSVRQPASFCGIYGLKPTYGRLSRYGLVAFASSFDQVGIFAKNVNDTKILFNSIAGCDKNDSTSSDKPLEDFVYNENDIKKIKIGIPKEYIVDGIDKDVLNSYNELIAFLKKSGFQIKEISLPNTKSAIATYYILSTAEASSNLARYDGVRYGYSKRDSDLENMYRDTRNCGFGDEVKRRILLGTFVLSSGYYDAYYQKAQKVRSLIKNDFIRAYKEVDIILTPTSPFLPFKIGEKVNDPLQMYLSDIFTVPMSLAGIPALNIPFSFSKNNLPIGMQLVGNYFQENKLFALSQFIARNN